MTEAELLDAIYAAPDDDAPRLVFADWLQERGLPRGEFIALQIARARGGAGDFLREAQLVAQHRDALVGPLADAIHPDDRRLAFERGFVMRAELMPVFGALAQLAGNAAWTTLRSLSGPPIVDDFYCDDRLRGLEELVGVSVACAVRLLRDARPRSLRALTIGEPIFPDGNGMRVRTTRLSELTSALHGSGLPKLRRLGVHAPGSRAHPDAFGWLWPTPVGRQLRSLVLHVDAQLPAPAPWQAAGAVPAHVQTLELYTADQRQLALGRRDGQLVEW